MLEEHDNFRAFAGSLTAAVTVLGRIIFDQNEVFGNLGQLLEVAGTRVPLLGRW